MRLNRGTLIEAGIIFSLLGLLLVNVDFQNQKITDRKTFIEQSATVHAPISIVGNAQLDAFFAGNSSNGSVGNPYIISNFSIYTINDEIPCISINDTNKCVIIEDCSLRTRLLNGNPQGICIELENCSNVIVQKSFIRDHQVGMIVAYSSAIEILDNTFNGGWNGIWSGNTNNSIFSNNTFSGSSYGEAIQVLDSAYLNLTSNIIGSGGGYGMWLDNVNSSIIDDNTISGCTSSGMYISQCTSTNITHNIVNHNYLYGISVWFGGYARIAYNTLDENGELEGYNMESGGIYIYHGDHDTIINNTLHHNVKHGISISDGTNHRVANNTLIECDILVDCTYLANYLSHQIETSNIINEKVVYYYCIKTGLSNANFTNAGQIILVECDHCHLSGHDLSRGGIGLYVAGGWNNIFDNITASSNHVYGMYLQGSSFNEILNCNVSNNEGSGINMWGSNNNHIHHNVLHWNGGSAIYEYECHGNDIHDNDIRPTWLEEYWLVIVLMAGIIVIAVLLLIHEHKKKKGTVEVGIRIDIDMPPIHVYVPRKWLFYSMLTNIVALATVTSAVLANIPWFTFNPFNLAIDLAFLTMMVVCFVVCVKAQIDDKNVHLAVKTSAWPLIFLGVSVFVESFRLIKWNPFDAASLAMASIMVLLLWIDELAAITGREYPHLVYLITRVGPVEYRTDDQLRSDYFVKKFVRIVNRYKYTIEMAKLLAMSDAEGVRDVLSRLMTFLEA